MPWPAWAAHTWPDGRIHTINTQQYPDKACLNACSKAIADAVKAHPDADLPKVGVHWPTQSMLLHCCNCWKPDTVCRTGF